MANANDLKLSTEVETSNHPTWGAPYAKGKIKTFFIPSVHFGREVVELIQRMDTDYENVTIDRISSLNVWGFGDFYGKRGGIGNFHVLYEGLEKVLTSDENFDVLVIPSVNGWDCFTDKTREAILKRVEKGTGLVMIQPYTKDTYDNIDILDKLSPLKPLYEGGITDTEERYPMLDKMKKDKWIAKQHYINDGIPFELFPYTDMGYFPYEANGQVILESESGDPIAAIKEYGKGKIIAFGYYARDILPQHSDFIGWDACYEPVVANWHGANHSCTFDYLEYFYSLINRSILWAANKEPDNKINKILVSNNIMSVDTSSKKGTFNYKIKDLYDNLVFESNSESSDISLPKWLELGGNFRVDVYLKSGDKIEDWSTITIDYPLTSKVKNLTINRNVAKPGEKITATVDVEGSTGELQVCAVDDYDRVIFLQNQTISDNNKVTFEYIPKESKSMHIRIQALIYIEGHMIEKVQSEKIIITSLDRDFHDFEVFICPQNRGQGDLSPLENQQLIRLGNTGLHIGDNKLSTLSGVEGLGIPWYEKGPYVDKKNKYVTTKDSTYLYRINCLNSPEFWDENEKSLSTTVNNNAKYGPVSYFANDEGSLTCYTDELDLCFCPHCMTKMQIWLKSEYSDISKLNSIWGTNLSDWSEAIPATLIQAEKFGNFSSWGDHRRFMELTFANAYGHIRDSIRKIDPIGKVRMSGTQMSTPYSGYDYYLLHQVIGYFEAYAGGSQFELHRSYANKGTVLGRWAGYGAKGMTATNGIWTAIYHDLTLISIFWEYSILNPDYTYSQSAIDYSKVFKEIKREGIGKLLLYSTKRDSLGIALHQSMTCIHGSYAKNDLPRYENDRVGWITILEDLGYQYNIMASQQIEAGKLMNDKCKILILPYAISLSDKEVSEIKTFVSNGGIVLGDFQTGIMDAHCNQYDNGRIDDIFGIKRFSNNTRPFYVNEELTRINDFPYGDNPRLYGSPDFELIESDTRVTTGKAAYVQDFSKSVPAIVVNEYGKGKGIYLNFGLHTYSDMKKFKTGGKEMREVITRLLALADVQKFVDLKSSDGELINNGYETIYYSNNDAKYVGILKNLGDNRRVGHDGLAIGNVDTLNKAADVITIQMREKAHVYDIREKKYLGFVDSVDAAIENGDTALLALMPYKVDSIEIDMNNKVSRGDTLDVNIKLNTDRGENDYANVLAINVYNPSGEYEWIYSENVSVNGKTLTKTYEIPHNEKIGIWKISAKDVATGVSTITEFEVV